MTAENQQTGGDADRQGPQPVSESADLVRLGLYLYGAMMAAAVIWRMGLYAESIFYANQAAVQSGVSVLEDLGLGLCAGLGVVAVSAIFTRVTRWGDELARELASTVGSIRLPDALLLALASGMGEELFFRGALQPRVGLVWASLIFGLVHFIPRRKLLPWTGFAILAGLLFGLLFSWTGNLIAPVTAHFVVNAINLPLLARRCREQEQASRRLRAPLGDDPGADRAGGRDEGPGGSGGQGRSDE